MHPKKSYLCSRIENFQLRQLGKAPKGGGIWDILFFIEVELIHNVSGVRQNDSDVLYSNMGFPGALMVKNQPAMQETWVQSLEKDMATHARIVAWRIPWSKEPGKPQYMRLQRVRHD